MVVVVMAVVTVVVVMAVMVVVAVMTVMAVMATAVHHVPTAATLAVGFSGGGGESRHADSNRCGEDEHCSALEHFSGSLVCSAGAIPGAVGLCRSRREWLLCWPSHYG